MDDYGGADLFEDGAHGGRGGDGGGVVGYIGEAVAGGVEVEDGDWLLGRGGGGVGGLLLLVLEELGDDVVA